ncbi:MAG: hypothetical protein J1F35_03495 [Erysipelotrichales bacterium]|nr:hypothetical protein [Erysipelotrichales bacterium]
MITYIYNNEILSFDENLTENVGETWNDYLDGKYVELSEDQIKFHEDNPEADIEEIWRMTLRSNLTYIQKDLEEIYMSTEFPLDPSEYLIGDTWNDYLDGKYVLLSEDQAKFHEDKPKADVEEVLVMKLKTYSTYIKRGIPIHYIEFDFDLDESLFDNLGTTWEDYLDNKWVKLSKKQLAFKKKNPNASLSEVWNMEITPEPTAPERTLEDAKREMIWKIDEYDVSENVNSFTINNMLSAWFSVQERLNYKQSIESAKIFGVKELSFYVGDNMLNIEPEKGEMMLAALQLYADQCFIITKQHKLNVESLETIEEVDNYDYKTGYPEKLNFDLI